MKRGGEREDEGTLSNSLVTENTNSVLDGGERVGWRGEIFKEVRSGNVKTSRNESEGREIKLFCHH